MPANTIDSNLIHQCAQAILSASPVGSRVILFGSRARGNARPDSDVDLMVIQPEVKSHIVEAARLARVIRPLRVPTDLVVVSQRTYDQWKDVPNSIYSEAANQGETLA